jgi:MoaA/NifB/PqqE/SkfB family radical SAM enzyme
MFSEPRKTTFLSFNRFKEIIGVNSDLFELQLEGGEPFLHPDFYTFLEYVNNLKSCTKITISSNGILLNKHLQRLVYFSGVSKIPLTIKRSINYYLFNIDNDIFKTCSDLHIAIKNIKDFKIEFNVRLRKEDGWITEKLKEYNIFDQSSVYDLQNYGRMEDTSYVKPFIVRNIDEFFVYASDGTCFNDNLVERSEYEKTLN